jgi:hypothetical protein
MRIRNLAAAVAIAAAAGTVGAVGAVSAVSGSVPASQAVPVTVTLTSAQHHVVHHLPRWVHWKYASRAASSECSTHNHRAIILWTTGGTSGSVLCSDGTSFSS